MITKVLLHFFKDSEWEIKEDDYQHLKWLDKDIEKPTLEQLNELSKKLEVYSLKTEKLKFLKESYLKNSTSSVSYKNVFYKGGEASASAISGAVQLAQSLKETSATIIDIEDKENDLTFEEAMELSALIAKAWRSAFFKYKELKRAVLAAQSVEELELIKW